MEYENKNETMIDTDRPPTLEEQVASLQDSIATDQADLALLLESGDVSDDEAREFMRDIEERELLLGFYYQTLEQMSEGQRHGSDHSTARTEATDKDEKTVKVDFDKVGWVRSSESKEIQIEKVGKEDTPVYLGSIIDSDSVTQAAADELVEQGEWDSLMEKLRSETLPMLWNGIREGRGRVRPISVGNRSPNSVKVQTSLNTKYPAYKSYVLGTNNEAIVLLVDKIGDDPVFVLAAMYDHDDQQRVLKHTFLKTK